MRAMVARISQHVNARFRRMLGYPEPYYFLPAPSVESQRIRFCFRGTSLNVEADYSTPLYETVAEVVDYDCYQLRLIEPHLRDTVILDVGANIGVTALCFSRFPGTRVVCFEPVPGNCERLKSNLALNGIDNVIIVQKAIARRNGTSPFWVPRHENVGGRVLEGTIYGPGMLIEVSTIDLATALSGVSGTVGLMKVDCEGQEYDIVDQLTPEIAARLSRLTFEIHYRDADHNLKTISRKLQQLGYALSSRADPFGREQLHHILATRGGADAAKAP